MNANAEQAANTRRGVTLLELLVVVVLMGIFAATAGVRFGRTIFGEFGSRSVAREISMALLTCQRAAIATGDDHYLEFLSSGGAITQYRIMRDTGGLPALIDGPKSLPAEIEVAASHTTLRYDFQGSAQANYSVTVTGTDRSWQISVVPITGTVSVTQAS